MNETKRQILKQLLNEAIGCLEFRSRADDLPASPPIDIDEYGTHLNRSWVDFSEESSRFLREFNPDISNYAVKSRLLDFMRKEFSPFIHDDTILTACHFLTRLYNVGCPLQKLVEQLLKIAIVRGIDATVSEVDRCTQGSPASAQYWAILEGISLEREFQVFDGVRLIPLPNAKSPLPRCLRRRPRTMSEDFFREKTLLIIDCCISPMFLKPFKARTPREYDERGNHAFRVKVNDGGSSNFNMNESSMSLLCSVLSFSCNAPVQISYRAKFWEKSELFNLRDGMGSGGYFSEEYFGTPVKLGKPQIDEAKLLYEILAGLESKISEPLRITVDRWVKSKTSKDPVDQIIDLGIAFECLYLSDLDDSNALSFQLGLRAAWHLANNKHERIELQKEFREIYNWRSKVVHTGKLPKNKKISFTESEVVAFIARAQELCRKAILKIMVAGKVPSWKDLILGD